MKKGESKGSLICLTTITHAVAILDKVDFCSREAFLPFRDQL